MSETVAALNLSTLDPEQFCRLQVQDPICRDLIDLLEGQRVFRAKIHVSLDEFKLKYGVLYHTRDLLFGLLSQLVFPPNIRASSIKIVHNSSTADHPIVSRIHYRLKDDY